MLTRQATVRSPAETGAFARLRRFNIIVGLIHLAQAVAMVLLSNAFALPVTRTFLTGPPGTAPSQDTWFHLRLGPAVAAFLALAALDHLLVAAPGVVGWYERMLGEERNDARWSEYSLSASLMIVLIAMLTGVTDAGALLAIAGVNAAMIFFGLLQERFTMPGREHVDWLPFVYGCIAGAIPWLIIAGQIVTSVAKGSGPPPFVYAIVGSLFVLFNAFAVNMALQYRRVGPWRDYRFGEQAYLVLSLGAKSLLAWLVFANILVQ